jgi:hypothetical protein
LEPQGVSKTVGTGDKAIKHDSLPFAPTLSASIAGRTMQELVGFPSAWLEGKNRIECFAGFSDVELMIAFRHSGCAVAYAQQSSERSDCEP